MINRLIEKYQQWNYIRKSKKTQQYSFRGIEIKILPGVFSPIGTRTTELFANYLLEKEWEDKCVLELGAGSGLISFLLSRAGAKVTASDISDNVIIGLIENAKALNLNVKAVHSDLFKDLKERYDVIVINPPFFKKEPHNIAEKAWYCGEHLEYFEALFQQFSEREFGEEIWMILSERATIDQIKNFAISSNLSMESRNDLISHNEQHFIFRIKRN